MKVASVVIKDEEYSKYTSCERLADEIRNRLKFSYEQGVSIVVFPALLGCIFENSDRYIEDMLEQSGKYKGMAICPGSFYEHERGQIYHSSCIMMDGNIIAKQKQIYLAKWEQSIGLSRGSELNCTSINGIKVCMVISTDVFYPQVSRAAAISGVELVLSPAAIVGAENRYRQLSGLWQNVQANLFFGIESGFRGSFKGRKFNSSSMIHAPLEMTEKEDGFMAVEVSACNMPFITAELDNEKRRDAVKKFNTLAQLNIEAYKDMFVVPGSGGRYA